MRLDTMDILKCHKKIAISLRGYLDAIQINKLECFKNQFMWWHCFYVESLIMNEQISLDIEYVWENKVNEFYNN